MADDETSSSIPANTGTDPNNADATDDNEACDAERHFASKNHCVKALVVMCRGLTDGDEPLLDISSEPWASMKIMTVKPTAKDFKDEIERRWVTFVGASVRYKGQPRPKQWVMSKILEWLDLNPITNTMDVTYLKNKVAEHKVIAQDAVDMKKSADDQLEKQWTGKMPVLRMIHCLVDHDDTKRLFLTRHDIDNNRLPSIAPTQLSNFTPLTSRNSAAIFFCVA